MTTIELVHSSKDDFAFSPPSTPTKKERRVSFRDSPDAQEPSPSSSGSPLLGHVALSLTDWLPYPSQVLETYSATRLRWAVRVKDWQPSLKEWNFMLSMLPQADQDQIADFKFLEDRKRRLISNLMQRKCINVALGVPWSQIRIRRTKGKKPWVVCEDIEKEHAPNFNFNVSHEGDYVVLASEPLCICGIDVAAPRQFRGQRRQSLTTLLDSLNDVFTSREVSAMKSAGNEEQQLKAFRRCWSLKEALGKARGDGLGMDFKRAEFDIFETKNGWKATVKIDGLFRPNWKFDLQELAGGHWMAVSRGPTHDIVDAWGDFVDSLDMPTPPPTLLQEALNAANPPLSMMQPGDLLPQNKLLEYEALTEL